MNFDNSLYAGNIHSKLNYRAIHDPIKLLCNSFQSIPEPPEKLVPNFNPHRLVLPVLGLGMNEII